MKHEGGYAFRAMRHISRTWLGTLCLVFDKLIVGVFASDDRPEDKWRLGWIIENCLLCFILSFLFKSVIIFEFDTLILFLWMLNL